MKKRNFFEKTAGFIVGKRKLFYLLFIIMVIYCIVSIPKVKVNYDIVDYLPDTTETKHSVQIMNDEFVTFGTAQIMISNVTYEKGLELKRMIERKDYPEVKSVAYDDTEDYYKDSCAKIVVTFDDADGTDRTTGAISKIRKDLEGYQVDMIAMESSSEYANQLQNDINKILVLAVIIITLMILFTSKSYMEIPIFFIIFGVAAVLNMGTNFWLGEISFVSNSVAIILQLALAIDYAIILTHRFIEEKQKLLPTQEAVVQALSKAIPEIFASSLTTVSGMIAMMFMQLKIGLDLGMVLSKSIICSLITVFILMPGLLMLFAKQMERTEHRNFVPKITVWGKFVVATRRVVPFVFIVIVALSFILQNRNEFVFSQNAIDSFQKTQGRIEKENVEEVFGKSNALAVIVPKGDYERERQVIQIVEKHDMINSSLGLSIVKLNEDYDYYITDKLTIKQFSEVMGIEAEQIKLAYIAYALGNEEYEVSQIDSYSIRVIDLVEYANDKIESGMITLDSKQQEDFDDIYGQLRDAKLQLLGDKYTRLVFNINGDEESPETFALLEDIRREVKEFYPEAYLGGNSTSNYDLHTSFSGDNMLISVLTILFVLAILLVTFKSVGIPIILILVIQGSVWLNFALPYLHGENIFFFSYIIVGAIQMGATIDYAIVMTNRFQELKGSLGRRRAAIETLNTCFPTIITSGSILMFSGFLIGFLVKDPIVSSIGSALGRGTLVSIISVMWILPQILILSSKMIDKTMFNLDIKDMLGIDLSKTQIKGIQIVVSKNDDKELDEKEVEAKEMTEELVLENTDKGDHVQ